MFKLKTKFLAFNLTLNRFDVFNLLCIQRIPRFRRCLNAVALYRRKEFLAPEGLKSKTFQ
jgi:hypothetical protein